MQYRQLGETDLKVSVVGFGASPLGGVFGTTDIGEGKRAVHLAIDQGVNFFDVSPYYGLTLAEQRLGEALEGRRSEVILATKCGRYGVDAFDFSAHRIRQSIEESLERLRTDYVDLFQAHDVEFGDVGQIIHETIPEMTRLQEEGKARYVGITGYSLKPLMRIADAVPVDTILSYCRYNLLSDDMDTVLVPFAERHRIGVINASPLHMRVLTERGAPEWHPAPPQVHEAARQALAFCKRHHLDLSKVALQYCFQYPRAASTLVGMSSQEHVCRNLQAFGEPADADILRQIRDLLAPASNVVWPSGRPENYD